MNKRYRFLKYFSATVLINLFLLSLLFFSLQAERPVQAAGPIYVDDDTCPAVGDGTTANPYCSIQDAVSGALEGDEIHVAGGNYTGTFTTTGSTGYDYSQVVYISKTLTLRGGYHPADWNADPEPRAYPSVIDAQRVGRGVTLVGTGTESVTIDGITITGGDYTGLGNPEGVYSEECKGTSWDCGGGLYAHKLTLDLRNSTIWNNYASHPSSTRYGRGGGIFLNELMFESKIENTQVISNYASGSDAIGGGLDVEEGRDLIIKNSLFSGNYAGGDGGGAYIYQPILKTIVQQSQFVNNFARKFGGGLVVNLSAGDDGLLLDRLLFQGNTAERGSGLRVQKAGEYPTSAAMKNLLFTKNKPTEQFDGTSAVYISNWDTFTVTLQHVTGAWNETESFIYASSDSDPNTLRLELDNALIAGFENAYAAQENGSGQIEIAHTNTFTSNVSNMEYIVSGSPTFIETNAMTGDPRLDQSGHIHFGSDAMNVGVQVGIQFDIDDEGRIDSLPDIGADEYYCHLYLPLIAHD